MATATATPVATVDKSGQGGGKAPAGMEYNGQGALVPVSTATAAPTVPTTPATPASTPTTTLTSPSALTSLPNLAPGATGASVSTLQNYLVSQGYMTSADVATGPGTYGPKTTAAVAAWQKANGINAGANAGYFGPMSKQFLLNPTSAPSGGAVTPAQVTPQSPLAITDPTKSTTGLSAAATSTSKSLQDIINSLNTPETDNQKNSDDLTKKLNDLMGTDLGKSADTQTELNNAGVPDLKKQLTAKNAEIQMLTAQKNQLDTDIQGKPITMDSIIGAKAQANAVIDAKIGVATAEAQALMGNITVATDTANQAVDAKYGPIEEEIKIRQQQLALLQPALSADEKKQATAQAEYLQEQQQQLQDTKDAEKQTQSSLIQWMGKYPDAGITLNDDLNTAQTKIQNSGSWKREQNKTTSTTHPVNPDGTPSKFTQTQLNKGAATAGISGDDFGKLDADSQNYFINNSTQIAAQKKLIDTAKKDGGAGNSPQEIEAEISSSNLPAAAKDYFTKYLKQVFGDYGAAPSGKPWWQFW